MIKNVQINIFIKYPINYLDHEILSLLNDWSIFMIKIENYFGQIKYVKSIRKLSKAGYIRVINKDYIKITKLGIKVFNKNYSG